MQENKLNKLKLCNNYWCKNRYGTATVCEVMQTDYYIFMPCQMLKHTIYIVILYYMQFIVTTLCPEKNAILLLTLTLPNAN